MNRSKSLSKQLLKSSINTMRVKYNTQCNSLREKIRDLQQEHLLSIEELKRELRNCKKLLKDTEKQLENINNSYTQLRQQYEELEILERENRDYISFLQKEHRDKEYTLKNTLRQETFGKICSLEEQLDDVQGKLKYYRNKAYHANQEN